MELEPRVRPAVAIAHEVIHVELTAPRVTEDPRMSFREAAQPLRMELRVPEEIPLNASYTAEFRLRDEQRLGTCEAFQVGTLWQQARIRFQPAGRLSFEGVLDSSDFVDRYSEMHSMRRAQGGAGLSLWRGNASSVTLATAAFVDPGGSVREEQVLRLASEQRLPVVPVLCRGNLFLLGQPEAPGVDPLTRRGFELSAVWDPIPAVTWSAGTLREITRWESLPLLIERQTWFSRIEGRLSRSATVAGTAGWEELAHSSGQHTTRTNFGAEASWRIMDQLRAVIQFRRSEVLETHSPDRSEFSLFLSVAGLF